MIIDFRRADFFPFGIAAAGAVADRTFLAVTEEACFKTSFALFFAGGRDDDDEDDVRFLLTAFSVVNVLNQARKSSQLIWRSNKNSYAIKQIIQYSKVCLACIKKTLSFVGFIESNAFLASASAVIS